mgnify:FL=1
MSKLKPLYVHDCERCVFIGNVRVEGLGLAQVADLYKSCNQNEAKYIFRFSDKGSDYANVSERNLSMYWGLNHE